MFSLNCNRSTFSCSPYSNRSNKVNEFELKPTTDNESIDLPPLPLGSYRLESGNIVSNVFHVGNKLLPEQSYVVQLGGIADCFTKPVPNSRTFPDFSSGSPLLLPWLDGQNIRSSVALFSHDRHLMLFAVGKRISLLLEFILQKTAMSG
jgi:hypothetical protein